jgi:hypothetical protein
MSLLAFQKGGRKSGSRENGRSNWDVSTSDSLASCFGIWVKLYECCRRYPFSVHIRGDDGSEEEARVASQRVDIIDYKLRDGPVDPPASTSLQTLLPSEGRS